MAIMQVSVLAGVRREINSRLQGKAEMLQQANLWEEVVAEIMESDVLRNYPQEMPDRLERAWKKHRSVMVQMPTGTWFFVFLHKCDGFELEKEENGGFVHSCRGKV